MKKAEILKFITSLRESDKYIKTIYIQGGCYQFYKVLKTLYPCAKPWINIERNHISTNINGVLYDINGVVRKGFIPLPVQMIEEVEGWSFSKTMALSFGECSFCEEPLLIGVDGI